MKEYADTYEKQNPTQFRLGISDKKFSMRFDPVLFCVARVKGSMITVTRNGNYVTRNASLFKKVNIGGQDAVHMGEEEYDDPVPEPALNPLPVPHVEPVADNENEPVADDNNQPRYPVRNRDKLHRFGQNVYEQ
jgi:hypothetical protein